MPLKLSFLGEKHILPFSLLFCISMLFPFFYNVSMITALQNLLEENIKIVPG